MRVFSEYYFCCVLALQGTLNEFQVKGEVLEKDPSNQLQAEEKLYRLVYGPVHKSPLPGHPTRVTEGGCPAPPTRERGRSHLANGRAAAAGWGGAASPGPSPPPARGKGKKGRGGLAGGRAPTVPRCRRRHLSPFPGESRRGAAFVPRPVGPPPPRRAPSARSCDEFFADWSALDCIFRPLPPSPLGRSPFDVSRGEGAAAAQSRPWLRNALGPSAAFFPSFPPFSLPPPRLPLSPPFPSLPREEGGGRERGGHLHLPALRRRAPATAPPPAGKETRRGAGRRGRAPGRARAERGRARGRLLPRHGERAAAGLEAEACGGPSPAVSPLSPGAAGPAPPLKPEPGPLPSQVSKQSERRDPTPPRVLRQ